MIMSFNQSSMYKITVGIEVPDVAVAQLTICGNCIDSCLWLIAIAVFALKNFLHSNLAGLSGILSVT